MKRFLSQTMFRLNPLWDFLLAPSSKIKDAAERRIARLVAAIHLGLLAVGLFYLGSLFIFGLASMDLVLLTGGAIVLLGFLYFICRTRHFRFAVIISLFYFTFQTLFSFLDDGASLESTWFVMLLIPLLFMTIIASQLWTLFVTVLVMAALVVTLFIANIESKVIVDQVVGLSIVAVFIVVIDNHRRGLEKLRLDNILASERHLHDILETTFQAIITVHNGTIKDVNAGFSDLFDSELSEPIGENIGMYIKGPDGVHAVELQALSSGSIMPVVGARLDGSQFDAELVVQDRTYQGEAATVLAIRDLTEQKKLAEAVQQAQRLDSLGVLAGGIAHDFNNLLTGITAQLSIADIKIKTDVGARKHLQKSAESALRASDLTKQLLAYAGKGTITSASFDTQKLIHESINLVESNLSKNIVIVENLATEPLRIDADKGQLQQVILNLILNASQAIENDSGRIVVSSRKYDARSNSQKPIDSWLGDPLKPQPYIELSIADNGVGMERKTISRIFEPFFTTKDTGTGLGLAATMGVINTHKGSIQVESALGEGTTFYVYLPLVEDTQGSHDKSVIPVLDATNIDSKRLTILVIDDQEMVRDSARSILEFDGHRVLEADSGKQGLLQLKENSDDIDLIILDMQMPLMNGETTFNEIRKMSPVLPVLLCSGYSESGAINRVRAHASVSFLQKPYDASLLNAAIRHTLQDIPQAVA